MQGPLADKVGDITGAAQGIGAADSARALITSRVRVVNSRAKYMCGGVRISRSQWPAKGDIGGTLERRNDAGD